MKYLIILMIPIFYSCASKKHSNTIIEQNSFDQIGSIDYKITKKYFTEKIKYYSSEKINKIKITNADWNKIKKGISSLNLTKINLLDSPTYEREVDGDWYSQIKIESNNKVYKTPHYDSSNPNSKLKKIDSLISYIAKRYSKINHDEFYAIAHKKEIKRKEKEFKDRIHSYHIVKIKPEFPGGSLKMIEFIENKKKNLTNKNSGYAWVYFIISEKGKIYDIKIRATNKIIKENSLKIMESMPKWNAGVHNEIKVKVEHSLKIEY